MKAVLIIKILLQSGLFRPWAVTKYYGKELGGWFSWEGTRQGERKKRE